MLRRLTVLILVLEASLLWTGCAANGSETMSELDSPDFPEASEIGAPAEGTGQDARPESPSPPSPDELAEALDVDDDDLEGEATYYGRRHHGRTTASGEPFDMHDYTAAHKTLPFDTIVRVTRPDTLQSVVVRINDRGPYGRGRVIDLSRAAAEDIGLIRPGHLPVVIEILELPPDD